MAQQTTFFRTYGNGIFDSGEGVLTTADTGYVVCGITTPSGFNGTDALLYKTDTLGNLLWWKSIGGNGIQGAKGIIGASGGSGFMLAGYQNSLDTSGYNFYLVRTDEMGDTMWTRAYGGDNWDFAYAIDTLQDGSYVIAGETYSFGSGDKDVYIIRVDQNGDTLWTRTFGGAGEDWAQYVYVERNNRIVVSGTTNSFGAGGYDLYMLYLDEMGDTIWTRTYGSADDEYGYSGDVYLDGGNVMSLVFGFTALYATESVQKMHFLRVDSVDCFVIYDVGVMINNPPIVDHPRIRKDEPGKFYYCGDVRIGAGSQTDIYLHRTLYGINFNYAENTIALSGHDWPRDIKKCLDSAYVITGETQSFGPGPSSSFIMRVDSLLQGPTTPVVSIEDEIEAEFNLYPNPVTSGTLFIEAFQPITLIKIYDLHGRVVYTEAGQDFASQNIYGLSLSSGVYVVEVTTTEGIGRKKLLVNN